MSNFTSLPSELVVQIFLSLDNHEDVINAGKCCKLGHSCMKENVVWEHLSRCRWRNKTYGHEAPWICDHTKQWPSAVEEGPESWMQRYRAGHQWDLHIDSVIRDMIKGPDTFTRERFHRIHSIGQPNYDSKDRLLEHMQTPDDAPDYLARRYWARYLLRSEYRAIAINSLIYSAPWATPLQGLGLRPSSVLPQGVDITLEESLANLDMFIRDEEEGDVPWVLRELREMALEFKQQYPDFTSWTHRNVAIRLVEYMAFDQGFRGCSDPDEYYDIANNFISLTLQSPERRGMPLIYVAIYCALARQLGLDARPASFPGHVLAIVYPREGEDLEGNRVGPNDRQDRMFVDPYCMTPMNGMPGTPEVSEFDLMESIEAMGVTRNSDNPQRFLEPASVHAMLLRVRMNIINCVHHAFRDTESYRHDFWVMYGLNVQYLISWMFLVLDPPTEDRQLCVAFDDMIRLQDGARVQEDGIWLQRLATIMESQPLTLGLPANDLVTLAWYKNGGHMPVNADLPAPKLRTPVQRDRIWYKVGTFFRHKRYQYDGIIIGWDVECQQTTDAQRHRLSNELEHGADQCFYHVITDDNQPRYVAQDNIDKVPDNHRPMEALMRMAGRYFLRWDDRQRIFISNRKREYPDD